MESVPFDQTALYLFFLLVQYVNYQSLSSLGQRVKLPIPFLPPLLFHRGRSTVFKDNNIREKNG